MSNSHVIPIVMENGTSAYVPPAHRKPEHIATFEPSGSYIHRLRPEHIEMLEQQFTKVKTLHNTDLELLAAEMGLNEKDVQMWYSDRLSLWRKEQGLADAFEYKQHRVGEVKLPHRKSVETVHDAPQTPRGNCRQKTDVRFDCHTINPQHCNYQCVLIATPKTSGTNQGKYLGN